MNKHLQVWRRNLPSWLYLQIPFLYFLFILNKHITYQFCIARDERNGVFIAERRLCWIVMGQRRENWELHFATNLFYSSQRRQPRSQGCGCCACCWYVDLNINTIVSSLEYIIIVAPPLWVFLSLLWLNIYHLIKRVTHSVESAGNAFTGQYNFFL